MSNNNTDQQVSVQNCPDCNEPTYVIRLDDESITYIPEEGFKLYLSLDELTALRAELGSYL